LVKPIIICKRITCFDHLDFENNNKKPPLMREILGCFLFTLQTIPAPGGVVSGKKSKKEIAGRSIYHH
jgi:hypothetical protein